MPHTAMLYLKLCGEPWCPSVFSAGHGFKLSPVVGKILRELALDQPPSYDLSPFRIGRFDIPKAVL